jgi:uncharacterized protein YaaW (UPF0174 family)
MDELHTLLSAATAEERAAFRKLLDTEVCLDDSPAELARGLLWLNQSVVEAAIRGLTGREERYRDVLRGVSRKLGLKPDPEASCAAMEAEIARSVVRTVWEKMTPAQRAEMDAKIAEVAAQHGKTREWAKAGGAVTAILAAEASGFGVYLLATTGLSAIAGLAGITLPFAVYTSMTSIMGVILGPVGWVGTGIFAIWKITGPNYQKLIPAVLYLAMLRQKYFPADARPPRHYGRAIVMGSLVLMTAGAMVFAATEDRTPRTSTGTPERVRVMVPAVAQAALISDPAAIPDAGRPAAARPGRRRGRPSRAARGGLGQ